MRNNYLWRMVEEIGSKKGLQTLFFLSRFKFRPESHRTKCIVINKTNFSLGERSTLLKRGVKMGRKAFFDWLKTLKDCCYAKEPPFSGGRPKLDLKYVSSP